MFFYHIWGHKEEKIGYNIARIHLYADFEEKVNRMYKDYLNAAKKANPHFDEDSDIILETKKAPRDKCPEWWKISVEPCERHSQ